MRLLLIAALLPLGACQSNAERGEAAQPSGTGTTRSFAATGFTGVELRGSDDVDVRTGPFAVTAEGEAKVLDQLDIRVVDGTLRIGRKQSSWGSNDRGARIHVVMPKLSAAALSGSGDLAIADLRADDAELSIAGSGDMTVAGSVSKLSASIAGSGDIKAKGLTATSADVSIAGSGNVVATVKGPASVSIIGSGDAELGGGAKCSVSAMGSGEAHCS
ncbi:DUF2807 domain-containing protein [Sphingomonas psychrotolerans]|uniref:DUF2807 domain-containing protein n=1 Tax=Sphingomonas psychrotolerans TaxID=1327635 RepID=A0ABU3N440_9SPHN|nr:head GIN domain-containing protein [Sphingomonas psychrotolerans]MDT8759300.1 DUF2807 domain-containing protein [Sphingomonas psychrotolerans]